MRERWVLLPSHVLAWPATPAAQSAKKDRQRSQKRAAMPSGQRIPSSTALTKKAKACGSVLGGRALVCSMLKWWHMTSVELAVKPHSRRQGAPVLLESAATGLASGSAAAGEGLAAGVPAIVPLRLLSESAAAEAAGMKLAAGSAAAGAGSAGEEVPRRLCLGRELLFPESLWGSSPSSMSSRRLLALEPRLLLVVTALMREAVMVDGGALSCMGVPASALAVAAGAKVEEVRVSSEVLAGATSSSVPGGTARCGGRETLFWCR